MLKWLNVIVFSIILNLLIEVFFIFNLAVYYHIMLFSVVNFLVFYLSYFTPDFRKVLLLSQKKSTTQPQKSSSTDEKDTVPIEIERYD